MRYRISYAYQVWSLNSYTICMPNIFYYLLLFILVNIYSYIYIPAVIHKRTEINKQRENVYRGEEGMLAGIRFGDLYNWLQSRHSKVLAEFKVLIIGGT